VLANPGSGGIEEKREVVRALKDEYPIVQLCKFLKLSRSGYYAYLKSRNKHSATPKITLSLELKMAAGN
jgi:hypothetical protein